MADTKFKKGNTIGSKGGRPKGSKEEFKKKIQSYLDSDFDNFIEELKSLKGRSRVEMYLKLMEFVVPKMKAVEVQTDETIDIKTIVFKEDK